MEKPQAPKKPSKRKSASKPIVKPVRHSLIVATPETAGVLIYGLPQRISAGSYEWRDETWRGFNSFVVHNWKMQREMEATKTA